MTAAATAKRKKTAPRGDDHDTTDEILGIRWKNIPEPKAYIGDKVWKISPHVGTASGMDRILDAMEQLDAALTDGASGKISARDMIKGRDSAVRSVLDVACPGLDYDREADDPDAGPVLLAHLAIALKDFGLGGGARGARLAQMRQRQGT